MTIYNKGNAKNSAPVKAQKPKLQEPAAAARDELSECDCADHIREAFPSHLEWIMKLEFDALDCSLEASDENIILIICHDPFLSKAYSVNAAGEPIVINPVPMAGDDWFSRGSMGAYRFANHDGRRAGKEVSTDDGMWFRVPISGDARSFDHTDADDLQAYLKSPIQRGGYGMEMLGWRDLRALALKAVNLLNPEVKRTELSAAEAAAAFAKFPTHAEAHLIPGRNEARDKARAAAQAARKAMEDLKLAPRGGWVGEYVDGFEARYQFAGDDHVSRELAEFKARQEMVKAHTAERSRVSKLPVKELAKEVSAKKSLPVKTVKPEVAAASLQELLAEDARKARVNGRAGLRLVSETGSRVGVLPPAMQLKPHLGDE